ncbi:MAG TPA: hypothetical protein PKW29_14170, partial [Clostridia bacterium]|nr:hypothetical protein [Clostridia bacterium]
KGCATEDYSDLFGAADYIERNALVAVLPPMCDSDNYSICTQIQTKGILRGKTPGNRGDIAEIM